jgi:excinuclease ABC subunit B
MFKLESSYKPTGDQPQAIADLTNWVSHNNKHQVLLGVTGSGKTFSIANLIQNVNKPTLIISHNKTLAAQLYQEFREYFPKNAVEYFVSYYDYYQPESYMPQTDTYIEKDADINEEIDKMRLSATTSLMTRKDVIIVSSVSCIYNLGSPAEYSKWALELKKGMKTRQRDVLTRLNQIYYERSEMDFKRGTYRVRGDIVDVYPAYMDYAVRLEFFGDSLVEIDFFEPLTGNVIRQDLLPAERRGGSTKSITQDEQAYNLHRMKEGGWVHIYPAKHYIANEDRRESAYEQIEQDLQIRLTQLRQEGKVIEAYRLEQRTNYDLEMMKEIGYCKGIENYSRYFDGRAIGGTPYTLMDFFPKDYLLIVDESHITIPQIRGMHNGDRARKQTLIDYGFRLPSALDNRPLNFNEYLGKSGISVYTSATPDEWELSVAGNNVTQQLIRPTGIIDPQVTVLPTKDQINDLLARIKERVERHERVLVTTLTKRMAEELAEFLIAKSIKVTYLHADIVTLERTTILDDLRKGNYDVLVGINLLREGLDLPEVSLVAIIDADKEGFLRSRSSLIQIMGRAARHALGEVVMYADVRTKSMDLAIAEIERRRTIQTEYNKTHNITPLSITKPLRAKLIDEVISEAAAPKSKRAQKEVEIDYMMLPPRELSKNIKKLEEEMRYEAENLNFEEAARLRDEVKKLKKLQI